MRIFRRFIAWRAQYKRTQHRAWLRRNKVILPAPDKACRRNSVESV